MGGKNSAETEREKKLKREGLQELSLGKEPGGQDLGHMWRGWPSLGAQMAHP